MKKRILGGVILVYIAILFVVILGISRVDFNTHIKPIKPCKKANFNMTKE